MNTAAEGSLIYWYIGPQLRIDTAKMNLISTVTDYLRPYLRQLGLFAMPLLKKQNKPGACEGSRGSDTPPTAACCVFFSYIFFSLLTAEVYKSYTHTPPTLGNGPAAKCLQE